MKETACFACEVFLKYETIIFKMLKSLFQLLCVKYNYFACWIFYKKTELSNCTMYHYCLRGVKIRAFYLLLAAANIKLLLARISCIGPLVLGKLSFEKLFEDTDLRKFHLFSFT